MQSSQEILTKTKTQLSAGDINTNTAVTAVTNGEIDSLISEFSDLTNGGKPMNAWYACLIREIGSQEFRRLAAIARQEGRDPSRYFSWLLKNARTGKELSKTGGAS